MKLYRRIQDGWTTDHWATDPPPGCEEFSPNIEAARESVDMPGLTLLLWRITELMGVPPSKFPGVEKNEGFAMMIRDSIVNKKLIAAALTPGDTK